MKRAKSVIKDECRASLKIALQFCPSGRTTADKRLRYATPHGVHPKQSVLLNQIASRRQNKSEERGKSGNRCNSPSHGGISLLGSDKKGIL